MPPKLGVAKNGLPMHYSVGAVISRSEARQNRQHLLIDRAKEPFGYAGLAGHVEDGETYIDALVREALEEANLYVVETSIKLLFYEEVENKCRHGIPMHCWALCECVVEGQPTINKEEAKSIGWYDLGNFRRNELEPVWQYWYRKLGLI